MAADESTQPALPDPRTARNQLLRDVIVFQFKLALDGTRDLILSPLSLVAALLDLVTRSGYFYQVVQAGRRSERWIDLFEAADRIPPSGAPESRTTQRGSARRNRGNEEG